MEKNKKNNNPEINEEMMMNLMVEGVKKEGLKLPAQQANEKEIEIEKPILKERLRNKRPIESGYESLFFKRPETNARDGKTVYIRPEFHEKLFRIVQVIGEDKITIYGYLDNLLEHHFQEFEQQITKSYNEKYKPIF